MQERLQETLPTFCEALDHFRQGRFAAARPAFAACVADCPEDTAAAAFVQPCADRSDGEWDGIERPAKS